MAIGETFKATVIGELDDGTAVVFDFGYADTAAGSTHIDTATAAGDFQGTVQDDMANALPEDFTFKKYRFACVGGTAHGEIGYVDVTPAVHGQLTAVNRSPNELCAALKRSTGYAARNERGRIFFGPLSVTVHDNANVNKVDTGGLLLTVANLLKANLVTQTRTLKPVILNAAGGYSGHFVTTASVAAVMVHRRTRRPRVGA